jgi:hypothetical protein
MLMFDLTPQKSFFKHLKPLVSKDSTAITETHNLQIKKTKI